MFVVKSCTKRPLSTGIQQYFEALVNKIKTKNRTGIV